MGKNNMNGSVNLLAKAMRQVFQEAVEEGVSPLRKELKEEIGSLRKDMVERIDTTNENMQGQFSEQENKIGKMLSKR